MNNLYYPHLDNGYRSYCQHLFGNKLFNSVKAMPLRMSDCKLQRLSNWFFSLPLCLLWQSVAVLSCWLNIFFLFLFVTATVKHLVYFSLDYRGEVQKLSFDQSQVHRLFYGSFHKVRYRGVTALLWLNWKLCKYFLMPCYFRTKGTHEYSCDFDHNPQIVSYKRLNFVWQAFCTGMV